MYKKLVYSSLVDLFLINHSFYLDIVVAGLEHAKKSVTQMVVWPLMRPDIFKGCRDLGSGLLLFGPPVSTELRSF